MESIYTKLALYGSKNECARTDTVFYPISEVCDGTVSLGLISGLIDGLISPVSGILNLRGGLISLFGGIISIIGGLTNLNSGLIIGQNCKIGN